MYKIILTSVFVFISFLNIFSQNEKSREFNSVPYPDWIETYEFTVLDINFDKNLVAFKHVFKLQTIYDEIGEIYQEPCNCNYTGMENKPFAGVVLGVYDLTKQEYLKTFVIYNATYEKSECTDYQTSTKNLEDAKKYFTDNNLDITKKPAPQPFIDGFININGLTFSYIYENNTNDDYTEMITKSIFYVYDVGYPEDKVPIYTILQQDSYYMASSGKIEYISVYKKDDKVVFLNLFKHISHIAGSSDTEHYHFSPVFRISDLKNKFE